MGSVLVNADAQSPATASAPDSASSEEGPRAEPSGQEVVDVAALPANVQNAAVQVATRVSDQQIRQKVEAIEEELDTKERAVRTPLVTKGHLDVNGPLPSDFSDRFAAGVAEATGCKPADVKVVGSVPVPEANGRVDEIMFESRGDIIAAVEEQAADPDSKLATGLLHYFLVARDGSDGAADSDASDAKVGVTGPTGKPSAAGPPDVDSAMPYGDLEPFGREDTAQELTKASIRESDAMIDQLERAEVAEEKRAVFRALTRLRGAAITSYDGIARSQTGNIEEYSRNNQWRQAHPVRHLADEEGDVARWAFPKSSDD